MRCVIFSVLSASRSIVVLNKIFKDVCKKIIVFCKSFFKAELYKFIYKCTGKGGSLAVICNILCKCFKNRNLCIRYCKCRKDFHILCSNIFHRRIKNYIKVAFSLLVPELGNKMTGIQVRAVCAHYTTNSFLFIFT